LLAGSHSIFAADNREVGINLGSIEGQQALEPHLDGVDLLILDNLSTLMTTGSEGATDSWLPMQNWLLRLRRRGIAVLLIHHAGVNGKQRGTNRREDALDLSDGAVATCRLLARTGGAIRGPGRKGANTGRRWSLTFRGRGRGIRERIWEGRNPVGGEGPETARPASGSRVVPGRPYRSPSC
jgi:hypothetical protein